MFLIPYSTVRYKLNSFFTKLRDSLTIVLGKSAQYEKCAHPQWGSLNYFGLVKLYCNINFTDWKKNTFLCVSFSSLRKEDVLLHFWLQ